jgi:hypothetical protein
MQKTTKVLFPALVLAAGTVQAEGWYLGASAGVMDNNVSGFDQATNAGALLGYDVYTRDILAVSLEAEATTTVADGDLSVNGRQGDWDIDTQAAYVAVRLGDPFYMKVRYGVLREDISARLDGFSQSDSDSGGSWGAALGWMLTPHWDLGISGTLVDGDVNYWSAGLAYHFQ